jgi:hypothetical protein
MPSVTVATGISHNVSTRPNFGVQAVAARLWPGSRAAYLIASVTASRPLQFASRSFELLGCNGRAARASARGTGRAAYTVIR